MGRMRIAFAAMLVAALGGALPLSAAPAACALTPAAGHRYVDIDVLEQGFSPFTQQAFAGDVVRWTVRSATNHILAPYAPANVPGFGSGVVAPSDVYCITFGGGSIWYRDARSQNSVVEADSNVCHGRCGSISDRTAEPAAPSINPPSGPSDQKPTLIQGTSEPFTLVKIASVPSGETAYDTGNPIGQALAGDTGAWKANLYVEGGSYNLVARAIDAAGRESVDSTVGGGSTVGLQVIQDTEPPVLTATPPTPPLLTAGTTLSGTVTDNARVTRVDVVVSDLRDGSNIGGDSGRATTTIKAWDCGLNPCAPGNVTWKFSIKPVSKFKLTGLPTDPSSVTIPVTSGIFNVRIVAYDAWLNASTTSTFQVVVIGVPSIGGLG
jgi:hypothetical protein